jgi:hypothetical protein
MDVAYVKYRTAVTWQFAFVKQGKLEALQKHNTSRLL